MLANHLTVSQAARQIGVSSETIRRWVHAGRVEGVRDGGRYLIPADDVRRVAAGRQVASRSGSTNGRSATRPPGGTNRFTGTVVEIEVNGLMSQVEIVVVDSVHLIAVISADAVKQMNLKPGMPVTAIFTATSPFLLPSPP